MGAGLTVTTGTLQRINRQNWTICRQTCLSCDALLNQKVPGTFLWYEGPMLTTTLPRLRCPACAGSLGLTPAPAPSAPPTEITTGTLTCQKCKRRYPIM